MPEKSSYEYPDPVGRVIDAGRVRVPRLQSSYISITLAERMSDLRKARKTVIGDDGDVLIYSSQVDKDGKPKDGDAPLTVEEWIDQQVELEPHGLVPAAIIDPQDDTWLSGNLSKQGERLKALEAVLPKKAALEALNAEAELYGTKVGSLRPGTKPNADGTPGVVDNGDSNSPFNPKRRFESDQTRYNEIEKGIKRFGIKWAQGQCAKFSVDLAGRPLRRK
jgi:hypothetical protein